MNFYISSTYSDLINEREKAAQSIRRLGHQAIAMEDYVASDKRPLEKCLEDVRSCDAYIGIVAFRYGYIPKKNEKSITHLEYEEAGKVGIPRLIFILKEDAPWIRSKIDKDPALIDSFRQSLTGSEKHLFSLFSNDEELATLVIAAVSELKGKVVPDNKKTISRQTEYICSILPYLSNRVDQVFEISEKLKEHLGRRKPLVCFVHGDEYEAHDTFVDRLEILIAKTISDSSEEMAIESHYVEWPVIKKEKKDLQFFKQFYSNLAEKLVGNRMATDSDIHNVLLFNKEPVIIKTHILSEDWQYSGSQHLHDFLRLWDEMPTLVPGKFLLICLYIKYLECKNQGFFKSKKRRKLNNAIRNYLNSKKLDNYKKITVFSLPELTPISRKDAEAWLESYSIHILKQIDETAKQEKLKKIRQIYEKSKHITKDGLIPMEYLANDLEKLLENK